jgi:hydroxymethylpyrimidine/phosphomethylpyrimidine kinase
VPRVPSVLSIAGSDSGGGAGIQADLKAFAACGVHGMTALTALTAQSTTGVNDVHSVPPQFIIEQVRAVQDDIGVDAVKIGMLATAATVAAVNRALDLLDPETPIVIDPVMVSESGAVLLDDSARRALVELLLPRATVITPNVPEARVLVGEPDVVRLHALGPANVVLTGGHREEATDLFYDGTDITPIPGERHPDGASHGSGCTHSSALAAHLAHGRTPLEAARAAKELASAAVRRGLREIGAGAGPVDALDVRTREPARGVINSGR